MLQPLALFSKPFALLSLLVLLGAVLSGAVVGTAEVLRPYTAPMEAERMSIENRHRELQLQTEARLAGLELQATMDREAAQTAAEQRIAQARSDTAILEIQESQRLQQRLNNLRVARETAWLHISSLLIILTGVCLCGVLVVGVVFSLVRIAERITDPKPSSRQLWEDEEYRNWRVTQARSIEILLRERELAQRGQVLYSAHGTQDAYNSLENSKIVWPG